MSDVREQAQRLVELQEVHWNNPELILPLREYQLELGVYGASIARAYLAECEAHERTKERLEDALSIFRYQVDKAEQMFNDSINRPYIPGIDQRAEGAAIISAYTRDFLASIEQKEDAE